MKELIPYIKDGISISKLSNGKYQIFTVPTQHFVVDSLEELTPSKFEQAIKSFKDLEEIQRKMMNGF